VGITVEQQPAGASKKAIPMLKVYENSVRSYTCNVTYQAESRPILFPPGATISLVAKGVSGDPGAPGDMLVFESWCVEKGIIPAGNPGFKVPLSFQLV